MDTKIPPTPGSGTREKVAESVRLSLEGLQVNKVRVRSDELALLAVYDSRQLTSGFLPNP
jgi:hypothetical protein